MIILLDMDEVIVNFLEPCLEKTGRKREEITSWDLMCVPEVHADFYNRRHATFYRNMSPMEGAIPGARELSKFAQVLIVSAVPYSLPNAYNENILTAKAHWIDDHMPFIGSNNLIATMRKEWVMGDILVDDKPANIEAWQATGRIGIIYDQPWNQKVDADYRAQNWSDVVTYCREIYEAREDVTRGKEVPELWSSLA